MEDCEKYRQELNLLVKQLMGSEAKSGQDVVTLDLFFDQDGYSRLYYSSQINVPVIVMMKKEFLLKYI